MRYSHPLRLLFGGALGLVFALFAAGSASAEPVYWIVNVNSGKALSPAEHSKGENWWIQQMTWFNGSGGAHHWRVKGSGQIRSFKNRHSHYCISSVDHEPQYPPAANGSPAIQRRCGIENNGTIWSRLQSQSWRISSISEMWAGHPFTMQNMRNGKCLEIYDWSWAENANTALWDCHGGANQQFRLVYAGEAGGS